MKKVSENLESQGFAVFKILCSSDVNSFDGIITEGKVAIIDGTPPHSVDMKYPGAVSETVDLMQYLDVGAVTRRRRETEELIDSKKLKFSETYRSLEIAEKMNGIIRRRALSYINTEKADKTVDGIIDSLGEPDGGRIIYNYRRSFGIVGKCRLDTHSEKSDRIIYINDYYGYGGIFTEMLLRRLKKDGYEAHCSPNPIGGIGEIYIDKCKVLVSDSLYKRADMIVNTSLFSKSDSSVKGEMKLTEKCRNLFIDDALRTLSEAGEYHKQLETVYGENMNFKKIDCFAESLTEKILYHLNADEN